MRKKSMMKNVLAVAMAATVAISVTGCKGKKNQDAASSAPSTSLSDSASTAQSETPDTAEKEDTSAAASESKAESEAESKPDSNAASTENKTAESEAASDKAEKPAASQNTNPDNVSTKDGPAKAPVYNTHKTTTGTKTPAQKPAAVTPAATPAEKKSQPVYTFTVRHHDATCTTQGYDEHICNEWGGMNYNDNYVAAKGHSWDNGTVTKAATYTETGIKTFKCKDCGETRTEEIPSLDKTYHILQVVAPTCTSEGYTIYECNEVPGLTYKGDFTDKTPHTYDEGVVTKEATIYEKGVKTFTCSACGDTYTEDIPMVEKTWHKGDTVAPTCTEQGYTVYICDQDATLTENRDFVDALDHDWGEGVVTKAATCTEDGEKTFTCSRDGATKTEVIPAVGHKWDDGTVTTPATCEASGVKTYKCLNDGCTETKTEEIAALGHNYDDGVVTKAATCTEDGVKTFTCQNDKSHTYTEVIPATGHDYDDGVVTTKPTYTENGVKTFTCHNCGDTYTESIPALGYTYNETVVAPTCTEDGYTMHECVEDATKSFKDNIVPALGHEYKEVTTPATCKDAGSVDKVCERCNDKQHVRDIPVNEEHQWDEGVITKEPTATEPGIKTYTCTVCGQTRTETIPATGVPETCNGGPACPGYAFRDMPAPSIWSHEGLDYCIYHGYIAGTSATTVTPDGECTRAMIVSILYRVQGEPAKVNGYELKKLAPPFDDVERGCWYTDAIWWAKLTGVVSGMSPSTFAPDDPITRAQLAVILYNYTQQFAPGSLTETGSLTGFPDADSVPSWARTAMAWAVGNGLISGVGENGVSYLRPEGCATRAQVATILMNYDKALG